MHGTRNWRSDLNLPLDESNEQGSTDNAAAGTTASNEDAGDATDDAATASSNKNSADAAPANSFLHTPRGRYMQAIMNKFSEYDELHSRDLNSDLVTEESNKWDALFFIAYFVNPDILEYDEWTAYKEGLFKNIQIDRCFDLDDGYVLADEEECNVLLRKRGVVGKNLIFDIVRKLIPEEYRIAKTTKNLKLLGFLLPTVFGSTTFTTTRDLKPKW